MSSVEKWKADLQKKNPKLLKMVEENGKKKYFIIFNDQSKTKYVYLEDSMMTRYGVQTISVLKGPTAFDLWNGKNINQDIFDHMLKVRNGFSELQDFDVYVLKDVTK